MTKKGFFFSAFLLLFIMAHAQDTLKLENVQVVEDYIPFLSDAVKEPTSPVAEPPKVELPKLSYAIVPVQFHTTSRLDIAPAMEMGKPSLLPLKNNHIKLGFGNYTTPLAELYLHNLRSEYSSYGLSYRHLSSKGPNNASFSDDYASLFGKRFFKKGTLYADFDYARNGVRYYGYDRTQEKPGDDSLKQVFNTFVLNAGYNTKEWGRKKRQVTTGITFHNITDLWGVQENDIWAGGGFKTLITKDDELNIKLSYNYSNYTDSLGTINRSFVNLSPRYNLTESKFNLSLGFNANLYKDTGDATFYFFPVVEGVYEIEKNELSAIGGVRGNLQKNTYRSLAYENQFIGNRNALNNSVNRLEIYLGIKGKTSANFGFTTRVFYNQYNDMMVFIGDSTVLRRFKPLYIDARVFRFNLELAYQYSEKIRFNFTGNLYNYNVEDSAQFAWNLPTTEFKINTTYNIGNKLLFSADVFMMNRRPAVIEYQPATSLGAFVDFNFGLEYRYRKSLSLFLKVNNISSVRYQRWYNYPVLGINAIGGLTFSL